MPDSNELVYDLESSSLWLSLPLYGMYAHIKIHTLYEGGMSWSTNPIKRYLAVETCKARDRKRMRLTSDSRYWTEEQVIPFLATSSSASSATIHHHHHHHHDSSFLFSLYFWIKCSQHTLSSITIIISPLSSSLQECKRSFELSRYLTERTSQWPVLSNLDVEQNYLTANE